MAAPNTVIVDYWKILFQSIPIFKHITYMLAHTQPWSQGLVEMQMELKFKIRENLG